MFFLKTKIYVVLFGLYEINTILIENNSNGISLENIFKKRNPVSKEENFIKNLMKRINYDSIVAEDLNRNTFINHLFKKKYTDPNYLLTEIYLINEKDFYLHKKYDIPTNKFFLECYDNDLLSKLFPSKTNRKKTNVVCFFIFSKYFLNACERDFIKKELCEGFLDDNAIDLICKALECAKRILSSRSSYSSTLQIIKDVDTNWGLYCTEKDETLLYALVLVKRMLCNIDLPFITEFDVCASDYFFFGLHSLNIEVIELNDETNDGTKKTICLLKYIMNHILIFIRFMNLDLQSKKANGKFEFLFSKYLYQSSKILPDNPLNISS